jgi:hypothetical protein
MASKKIAQLNKHIAKVFKNQERLRENIVCLEKVSAKSSLVDSYIKDLNNEEDDLIRTRKAIDSLEALKTDLSSSIKNLKMSTSNEASKMLLELFD